MNLESNSAGTWVAQAATGTLQTPGFHVLVEHESICSGVERPQVLEFHFRFDTV